MERIGEYDVIEPLGSGGMGTVFLCRHPRLPSSVAIKLLNEHADERARVRFEREANTMASLRHPNIVQVMDVGLHEGRPYIVMEFIEGEDLTKLIARDAPLPPIRALVLTRGILDGLAYAHAKNVVHRDIKPSNVRAMSGDHVKILDFGIAHLRDQATTGSGSTLTRAGRQPGTDDYMSPEQVRGHLVDPRSDLFSTGIVLYELFTGKHPFRRRSPLATRHEIKSADPAPPRAHRPDLPLPVCWLVQCALEREPENRPESAEAFAQECRRLEIEFHRGTLRPGPSWREGGAAEDLDARSIVVLGREAEFTGHLERAVELYQQALALDPSLDELYDRLLVIEDARARPAEVEGWLRATREALAEGRLHEAVRGLREIRRLDPDWRSRPELVELDREVKRRLRASGERWMEGGRPAGRTPGEMPREYPGTPASDPEGAGLAPARASSLLEAVLTPPSAEPVPPSGLTPPSGDSTSPPGGVAPRGERGVDAPPRGRPPAFPGPTAGRPAEQAGPAAAGPRRAAPEITAPPATPQGRLMAAIRQRVIEKEWDRALQGLRRLRREYGPAPGVTEFLGGCESWVDAENDVELALAAEKQDRLEDSMVILERALEKDPDNVRARFALSRIKAIDAGRKSLLVARRSCDEARTLILQLPKADPLGVPAARMIWRAKERVLRALEAVPTHQDALGLQREILNLWSQFPREAQESAQRLETEREPTPAEQQRRALLDRLLRAGEGVDDADLRRILDLSLADLRDRAGPGRLPSLESLQEFDRSLDGLLKARGSVASAGGGDWPALANLAQTLSRSGGVLADGHALLSNRCLDAARSAAIAHLSGLVEGPVEILEVEIREVTHYPALERLREGLSVECRALLDRCRQIDGERRLTIARGALRFSMSLADTLADRLDPALYAARRETVGRLLDEGRKALETRDIRAMEEITREIEIWIEQADPEVERHQALQRTLEEAEDLLLRGELPEARAKSKEALAIFPDYPRARLLYIEIKKRLHDREQAAAALETARRSLAEGDLRRAGERLAEAAALDPGGRDVVGLKAQVEDALRRREGETSLRSEAERLIEASDWTGAKVKWEALIAISPGDAQAQEALERIARKEDTRRAAEEARRLDERIGEVAASLSRLADLDRDVLGSDLAAEVDSAAREAVRRRPSADSKKLRTLLAGLERLQGKIAEVRARACDAADARLRLLAAEVRGIPEKDRTLIGGNLVGRALEAAESAGPAGPAGDLRGLREALSRLEGLAAETKARRRALQDGLLGQIHAESEGLEEFRRSHATRLGAGRVQSAGMLRSEAVRAAAGPPPSLSDLQDLLERLKAWRIAAQQDLDRAIQRLKEQIQALWARREGQLQENPGALQHDESLRLRHVEISGEIRSLPAITSPDRLERLLEKVERFEVPPNPWRRVRRALVGAAMILSVAAGAGGWYYQTHRLYSYDLRISPWGEIVRIERLRGAVEPVQPPGRSPLHRLSLARGSYLVVVRWGRDGRESQVSVEIPEDGAGAVAGVPDAQDIREILREVARKDAYLGRKP